VTPEPDMGGVVIAKYFQDGEAIHTVRHACGAVWVWRGQTAPGSHTSLEDATGWEMENMKTGYLVHPSQAQVIV